MNMNDASELLYGLGTRSVWNDKSDIPALLEAGGYKADVAGGDFPRLLNAARALLDGAVRGLVINGPAGSGKTLAASILAQGILSIPVWTEDGRQSAIAPARIECTNLPLVTQDERNDFCLARGSADWWLEDLGNETQTNEFGVRFDPVVNFVQNVSPRARILITTNLDGTGIRQRYGDRVLSRLMDHFGWIRFTRGDRRADTVMTF